VKLGCQHVRCLQCKCKCKRKCKLSCLHTGRVLYIRTTIWILGRLFGSTRLSTVCIAAIDVHRELAACFCSCSKVALFPLPDRHPFMPETRHGPMVWYVE
jgi:hypothetical protein